MSHHSQLNRHTLLQEARDAVSSFARASVETIRNRLNGHENAVRIRQIPDSLSSISASLRDACKNVEPHFIRLGEKLQSVHSDASRLTQQTQSTVKLIAGEADQGLLEKTDRLANTSRSQLERCCKDVSGSLEEINTVAGHLGNLHDMCTDVDKIARVLSIVGLNIGIESTRSTESSEMFAVVAQEIRGLAEQIIKVTESIRNDSKTAQDDHAAAHDELSGTMTRLHDVSLAGEQAVLSAVQRIEQLMKLSLQALDQSRERTQKISRQIGEIVMGIQFHDNMRQRSEHIIEALQDIESLFKGRNETGGSGNRQDLRSAHAVVSLQAAQMKQVITETEAVYGKNKDAFAKIAREIEALMETVSVLGPGGSGSERLEQADQGKDPFATLRSAFETLYGLFEEGEHLTGQIQGIAHSASEGAVRLSSHVENVRKIGMETHINALNAIVKAAHLGEKGITLEVLAQEMSRLSNQSNEFVANVVQVLEAVTKTAQTLAQKTTSTQQSEQGGEHMVKASLGDGIKEITRAYEQFKKDTAEAATQAHALQQAISETSEGLNFLPDLAEELTGYLIELEEMSQALNQLAGDESDGHDEGLDRLNQRYTMAEERLVHGQTITVPQAPQETDTNEVVFDNFNDWSGGNEANADVTNANDGSGNGVEKEIVTEAASEKASAVSEAPPVSEATTDEEEDLGDNVELF